MKKTSFSFDGFDFSELIPYIKVDRQIYPPRENFLLEVGKSNGAKYTGYKRQPVIIPMEFQVRFKDVNQLKRKLAALVYKKDLCRLVFGSEPDKYYMAVVDESTDFDDFVYLGKGKINWLIPDGVAYSLNETTVSSPDANGNIIFDNAGSAESYPTAKITINSETGLIGLINQDGQIVQLGDPDEVDIEVKDKSVMLFDDHLDKDRGWSINNGVTPPVTARRFQNGKIVYIDEGKGEGYARVDSYGTSDDEKSWRGATITKTVPADKNGKYANNWTSDYRIDFNTKGVDDKKSRAQVGHNSVTYVDQHNNIIASVVIEDNNKVARKSDLALYVKNERVWDSRETDNFYVTGREKDHAFVRVEKMGNKITFSVNWAKINKSFVREFSDDTQLRKITWYGAVYGNKNTPMTNNLIRALRVEIGRAHV